MKIINNFGGIDKEIYNIGDILHKVGKNYLRVLPIVCNENGEDFEDYRIYGSTGGVGDETPNLFNAEIEQGSFISSSGAEYANYTRVRSTFEDDTIPAGTYTINAAGAERVGVYVYDATKNYVSAQSVTEWKRLPFTFTINNAYYVRFVFSHVNDGTIVPTDVYNIMLNAGSTPSPYGYEVDMGVQSGNLFSPNMEFNYTSLAINNEWRYTNGITKRIPCEPNQKYNIYLSDDTPITVWRLAVTASDDVPTYQAQSVTATTITRSMPTGKRQEFTTPNDAKYILFQTNGELNEEVNAALRVEKIVTTPIYIGSSPLETNEYIDYDSGKIYRMSGGILTPTDPPVPLPSIPTVNGKTIVNYAGAGTAPEKAWFSGMEFEIEDVYFGDKHIFSVWGEYDGTLPAQYSANGDYLADYRIYGAAGGVGDDSGTAYGYAVDMSVWSGNQFDPNAMDPSKGYIGSAYIRQSDGAIISDGSYYISEYIAVEKNANYTWIFSLISPTVHSSPTIECLDMNYNRILIVTHEISTKQFNFVTPQDCKYIRASVFARDKNDSALYNYTTTPIYIGSDPLEADEYVDYGEGKIYRMSGGVLTPTDPPVPLPALPTVDGTNIVDYAGQSAAVPSRFYAKYKKG